METKPPSAIEQFVRDLMPGRTGADIEEAVYNFMEYLKVVGEISERLEREGESLPTAEEIAVLEQEMNDIPEGGRKRKKK